MQVKFSGENHGFLWQNVKFKRLIFEDKMRSKTFNFRPFMIDLQSVQNFIMVG